MSNSNRTAIADSEATPSESLELLPDLCRLPVVLAVLLVTELVVIVYVLSLQFLPSFDWEQLALLSLYGQWVALLIVVGLCQCRRRINAMPISRAVVLCFAWVAIVALATNLGAQWVAGGFAQGVISLSWLLRDLIIILVVAAVGFRYMYVLQRWRFEQKAKHGARIDALHARIRPHFLFNSMNTIASLISYAPDDAEKAVEDLAALFRASLSQSTVTIPWQREREVCEAYLRIEGQRLADRLTISWSVDCIPQDFELPPLILQPLIENAIYHGIENLPQGGLVEISSELVDDHVLLRVSNPVLDGANAVSSNRPLDGVRHNGIALENIRVRPLISWPKLSMPLVTEWT